MRWLLKNRKRQHNQGGFKPTSLHKKTGHERVARGLLIFHALKFKAVTIQSFDETSRQLPLVLIDCNGTCFFTVGKLAYDKGDPP